MKSLSTRLAAELVLSDRLPPADEAARACSSVSSDSTIAVPMSVAAAWALRSVAASLSFIRGGFEGSPDELGIATQRVW